MVKVYGFRVKLTEVEAALAAAVAPTVAIGRDRSKDGLWAWVTPEALPPPLLLDELPETLPQYVVPQRPFVLRELPLTPNGRFDKGWLLAGTAEESRAPAQEGLVVPQAALEQRLAAAVARALGQEQVSVTADLRSSGMSSLKSVMLAQRRRGAGLGVPLGTLYELHTAEALAAFVVAEHQGECLELEVAGSCEGASGAGCSMCCGAFEGLV